MGKNFRMPKIDFEALVAELRPYISPNPLSPNYRALNVEKKVAIALYYLKDTARLVWLSIVSELLFAQLLK